MLNYGISIKFWLHINSLVTVFTRSEAAATEYFMLAKEATIRERILFERGV